MPQTIGNPGTWLASAFGLAGRHAADSAQTLGSEDSTPPRTRHLTNQDLRDALSVGWRDFQQCRTDVMFLVLLYPVIGIVLTLAALNMDLVPLIFPLIAGFALLGPVTAAIKSAAAANRAKRSAGSAHSRWWKARASPRSW